ncbi:MAG TPA: LuxR C-terminal-related transcriptional regulator, partial [Caldilineaceae bacterium]|nr:LuxR C-terminal-related transcriptional regulator [Caldilineaceae bacterium]
LPRRIVEVFTYAAVRVALARGDQAAVEAWLATAPDSTCAPAPGEEPLHLLLARVWAARGAYPQALDLLARLQPVVEARAMGRLALETQLCRAAVLAAAGAQEAAEQFLAVALAQAAPEGFVRLFVEEGEPLRRLLACLLPQLADDGLRAYGNRLLEAFPPSPQPDPQPETQSAGAPAVEPLSPRELEVLRLVARGLSDRAVAEQLVVVTGTVKRHLSNIYDKLGVHSRTQALARARALGWLKPDE